MIFPVVQKIESSGGYSVGENDAICVRGAMESMFVSRLRETGFRCSADGKIKIETRIKNNRSHTYIEESRRVSDEKYFISSSFAGGSLWIKVSAGGRRGLYHACSNLIKQLSSGKIALGEISDYPLFAVRGYIEGFYGKPWSFEERADMLRLMAFHGMNTYYYAPKNDPYHREQWDAMYPEKELAALKRLMDIAQRCCVSFVYCIAPGLGIKYSSDENYERLLKKLLLLYDAGARDFGLLLDDIPPELFHEEDRECFDGEAVNAHIYLVNRLYTDLKKLDPTVKLTVCPLEYHGTGDGYYISKFGQNIPAGVRIFWTGRNICSQELTEREAMLFSESVMHRPLYWDNFPVNDAEMCNELHLGYLTGRDRGLYRYSAGLIANCMEYCECSKVPLLTVADYLWNPEKYDELTSWRYALKTVLGDDAEAFEYFADNMLTSCLKIENSPKLNGVVSKAGMLMRAGDARSACGIIRAYTAPARRCAEMIGRQDKKLYSECQKWLGKFRLAIDILDACADTIETEDLAKALILKDFLSEYQSMPETVADFSLREAAETVLKKFNL